jgi:hypothetical protein
MSRKKGAVPAMLCDQDGGFFLLSMFLNGLVRSAATTLFFFPFTSILLDVNHDCPCRECFELRVTMCA